MKERKLNSELRQPPHDLCSYMLLPGLVAVYATVASADEIFRENALGFTFSGSSSLEKQETGWAVSFDYARLLRGTRWYGSGYSMSVEYERNRDTEASEAKTSEVVSLFGGIFYDLSSITELAISLGQGVREKKHGRPGWESGGNLQVNAALARDIETPLGSHTLGLRADYDITDAEWGIGVNLSMARAF